MHKWWADGKFRCWLPGYLGLREKVGEEPITNGPTSQWV